MFKFVLTRHTRRSVITSVKNVHTILSRWPYVRSSPLTISLYVQCGTNFGNDHVSMNLASKKAEHFRKYGVSSHKLQSSRTAGSQVLTETNSSLHFETCCVIQLCHLVYNYGLYWGWIPWKTRSKWEFLENYKISYNFWQESVKKVEEVKIESLETFHKLPSPRNLSKLYSIVTRLIT